MALQISRSGFVRKVADSKWPVIEEAFGGFDPEVIAGVGPAEIEELLGDPRVIRNRSKIEAVCANAEWIVRVSASAGGFGRYAASRCRSRTAARCRRPSTSGVPRAGGRSARSAGSCR